MSPDAKEEGFDSMRFMNFFYKRFASAVFVLVLASASPLAAQSNVLHSGGQDLTGTWLVDVSSPVAGQFFYLITFNSDGTAAGTASDGTSSAQYGVWTRVDNHRFVATMMLFIFDANRKLSNIVKGRIQIALDDSHDTFRVTTERVVLDLNGNEIVVIPGVIGTARRVPIELQKYPVAP
jgi:hypothetical protein